MKFREFYYISLIFTFYKLYSQSFSLKINNTKDCLIKFRSNNFLGLVVFLNLILGKYGKVPGKINKNLSELAKKIKPDEYIQEDLDSSKSRLKSFCKENKIKDFSQRLENVLSYIFFPNVVEEFFLKKGSKKETDLEQLQEEIGFVIRE